MDADKKKFLSKVMDLDAGCEDWVVEVSDFLNFLEEVREGGSKFLNDEHKKMLKSAQDLIEGASIEIGNNFKKSFAAELKEIVDAGLRPDSFDDVEDDEDEDDDDDDEE